MRISSLDRLHRDITGEISLKDQVRELAKDAEGGYLPKHQARSVFSPASTGSSMSWKKKQARTYLSATPLPPLNGPGDSISPKVRPGSKESIGVKRTGSKESGKNLKRAVSVPSTTSQEEPAPPGSAQGSRTPPGELPPIEKTQTLDSSYRGLVWVARESHLPLDATKEAADLFLSQVSALDKFLDRKSFAIILGEVTGQGSSAPDHIIQHAFKMTDTNKDGKISFSEFVDWFATVSFTESMALDDKEREFREFCKSSGFGLVNIERFRRIFEEVDEDGSGEIDEDEFEKLLLKCGKVPKGIEIPAARFHQLWKEADTDCSGSISFEEFATFYSKHFDVTSGPSSGGGVFEGFYRNVRPPLGVGGN